LLFLWGVVATSVLTDVIKVSVGMLRPNFLAICNPNITCTNSEEFGIYHTDYVCQVQDQDPNGKILTLELKVISSKIVYSKIAY
jgi:hypothetical protein